MKSWLRRQWIAIAASVVVFLIGIGIGAGAGSGKKATTPPETVTVTRTKTVSLSEAERAKLDARAAKLDARAAKLDAQQADLRRREKSVSAQERVAARSTFDDGTYLVGSDIAAGSYVAPGSSGGDCYWARLKPGSNDIIDNYIGAGQVRVTVYSGELFNTQGCGTWHKG
jgi:hypothetical protein